MVSQSSGETWISGLVQLVCENELVKKEIADAIGKKLIESLPMMPLKPIEAISE